ncbi:MAG: hypothetical protein IPN93_13315 [Bacteroidetes bacterium]|nr:hypothetical protein [Bacteroidota bacterium]
MIVAHAVSLQPLPSVNIVLSVYVPTVFITAFGKLTVAVEPLIALGNEPVKQAKLPLP